MNIQMSEYYETKNKPILFMNKGKLNIAWNNYSITIDENNNAEYFILIDQAIVPADNRDVFFENIIELDAVKWTNKHILKDEIHLQNYGKSDGTGKCGKQGKTMSHHELKRGKITCVECLQTVG